jgi:hypothetical protein
MLRTFSRVFFDCHLLRAAAMTEFGWIVRERIVPGVNIVWLFHPADIK